MIKIFYYNFRICNNLYLYYKSILIKNTTKYIFNLMVRKWLIKDDNIKLI